MQKQQLYILAGIGIILIGGVFLMRQMKVNQKLPQNQVQEEKVTETSDTNRVDTPDWKTYRNEEYGFEVKMPENWEVDVQSHNGNLLPSRDVFLKKDISENKENSIEFSFGPHESKAGGYVAGIYIESKINGSVGDAITRDFSWENRESVSIQGQPAELLCWKSGCKQGETGIDKRFIFEKDGLVWQIFAGVSAEKGSKEKVQEIESFFSSFRFLN